MKKILTLILLSVLFFACSSDDDNGDDIKYLDNKLIEGRWFWVQATDSSVLEFNDDVSTTFIYDKYTERLKQTINDGEYKITSEKIYYPKYPKDEGRKYKLKDKKLSILESDIWIDYNKIEDK